MLHAGMHMLSTTHLDEMSFSELDALREQIDLPQIKLCQRGDINPATYTRWRRWARGEDGGSKPHPRSLSAVREVLRVELARQPTGERFPIAS
ncbi:MAG: hypothetical protein ACRCS9_08860 [Hyphomicrobium sp.]